MAAAEPTGRSVINFDTEDDLRLALMNMTINSRDDIAELRESEEGFMDAMGDVDEIELDDAWDWTVTNYDVEVTEPQTIAKEVSRLRALQSYQIVGAEREEAFDRLCNLGARVFDVPLTFVVLIDLGRQWWASQHGLDKDAREGPRNMAFCRYTILERADMLVVNDCTEDSRFRDNVYVTGEAHLRFYAGAPLLSPEGHRIGTYCICDTKPWTDGMSEAQKESLKDFAAMAMKAMVDRRELKQKVHRDASHLVASAAYDLMAPLLGMRHTLVALQQDEGLQKQLEPRHKKSLQTTMATADIMQQICTTTLQHVEETEENKTAKQSEIKAAVEAIQNGEKPTPTIAVDRKAAGDIAGGSPAAATVMDVKECMQRLHSIIDPLPKQVPVIFSVEPDVPLRILSDDVKILRASLNLLSNACSKTTQGQIQFRVFLRGGQLVFECEDSRTDANVAAAMDEQVDTQDCFMSKTCCNAKVISAEMSALGLNSLSSQVSALGGKYGYRSHGLSPQSVDAKGRAKKGVYFWFSIPVKEPDASSMVPPVVTPAPSQELPSTPIRPIELKEARAMASIEDGELHKSCSTPSVVDESMNYETSTVEEGASATKPASRYRRALVIEDSVVVRKGIARALTKQGYEVVQAADGVEGLAELQGNIFDITFCDFMMPNLNGIQCVEQYRQWEQKNRPHFSQYIIGISAFANEGDVRVWLAAGMNEYRPKPMTTKVIVELCNGTTVEKLSAFLDQIPFRMNRFIFTETDLGRERSPEEMATAKLRDPRGSRNGTRNREDMELEATERASGFATIVGGSDSRSPKRVKHTELFDSANIPEKVCLLGTKQHLSKTDAFARNMDAMGWRIVKVDETNEVVQLLKTRRWGAVLLFDDLHVTSDGGMVTKFREWEKTNRGDRQGNVFLVRGCGINSSNSSDSLPTGFDGELDRGLLWEYLKGKLGGTKPTSMVHGSSWNVVIS
jgi:CheY-like chemotaxis protein